MAVTHGTATRTAAADTIVDRVDAGGGAGKLKIRDAANVVLATIALPATAFSAAVAGVATLLGVPLSDTSADATGTAANFVITDSADVTIFGGSVTATGGGGDLTVDNTSIVAGQTVTVTGFTYTAMA
jgi:hypothetical protein